MIKSTKAKNASAKSRGGVRPGRIERKDRQSSAWVRDVALNAAGAKCDDEEV
jgi:hypothetical protein